MRENKCADVVIRMTGRGRNDIQLMNMAEILGLKYRSFVFRPGYVLRDTVRNLYFLMSLLSYRDTVYVGSWLSGFLRNYAKLIPKRKTYYLDDGAATLLVSQRKEGGYKGLSMYTFFNVDVSPRQTVVQHSFENLKKRFATNTISGAYFAGQPLIERGYIDESTYLSFLKEAVLVSEGELFYVPHRVEAKKVIEKVRSITGVTVLELDESLELHFLRQGFYPKHMLGVYSTALITVANMSKETSVHSFDVRCLGGENTPDVSVVYEAMAHYDNITIH